VVFGGYIDATDSYDPELHCFDLQRRRWSDLVVGGEHPHARSNHAVIPCGGGVLIFCSNNTLLDDTFLLRV